MNRAPRPIGLSCSWPKPSLAYAADDILSKLIAPLSFVRWYLRTSNSILCRLFALWKWSLDFHRLSHKAYCFALDVLATPNLLLSVCSVHYLFFKVLTVDVARVELACNIIPYMSLHIIVAVLVCRGLCSTNQFCITSYSAILASWIARPFRRRRDSKNRLSRRTEMQLLI